MKIAVDLGHGIGQDRGAVGAIREEEIINNVGRLLIDKLKKIGHTVYEVRPTKSAYTVLQSLHYRTTTSNSLGVQLYISLHANAGGGEGAEVFTFGGKSSTEASGVLKNLVALGFRNRGIKDGSGLYVIRHTNARSMLIEVCFVDNKNDVDKYRAIGADAIAEAIVKGISNEDVTRVTTSSNDNVKDSFVKRLQKALNAEENVNLVVDGIVGPLTLAACPVLKINSTGNIVKLVQEKLNVTVDGVFGNNTKNALINFQKNNNLVSDGIIGVNTWKKLLNYVTGTVNYGTGKIDNTVAKVQKAINKYHNGRLAVDGIMGPLTLAACPTLKVGSIGEVVKILQEILKVSADGIFGSITKNAVITYQKANNLVVDGIVGKNTWKKLLY